MILTTALFVLKTSTTAAPLVILHFLCLKTLVNECYTMPYSHSPIGDPHVYNYTLKRVRPINRGWLPAEPQSQCLKPHTINSSQEGSQKASRIHMAAIKVCQIPIRIAFCDSCRLSTIRSAIFRALFLCLSQSQHAFLVLLQTQRGTQRKPN